MLAKRKGKKEEPRSVLGQKKKGGIAGGEGNQEQKKKLRRGR